MSSGMAATSAGLGQTSCAKAGRTPANMPANTSKHPKNIDVTVFIVSYRVFSRIQGRCHAGLCRLGQRFLFIFLYRIHHREFGCQVGGGNVLGKLFIVRDPLPAIIAPDPLPDENLCGHNSGYGKFVKGRPVRQAIPFLYSSMLVQRPARTFRQVSLPHQTSHVLFRWHRRFDHSDEGARDR